MRNPLEDVIKTEDPKYGETDKYGFCCFENAFPLSVDLDPQAPRHQAANERKP
jgi:hypothetical protein